MYLLRAPPKGPVVTNMADTTPNGTKETRAKTARRRGNFYDAIGVTLLVGLLVVVGLGVLGITSLGWFSLSTGMAMIGLAIGLVAMVSFITLVSMRRTLSLVTDMETALVDQADRHAALAARNQAEWKAAQVQRDRNQDALVAELSRRQDSSEMTSAIEAEMNRSDRADRLHGSYSLIGSGDGDPFKDGDIHPVQDVEGIAEHFGPLLDQMGITDTEKLWHADTGEVAQVLKVSPLVVEQWKCQCELMAIDDIGKQYAELLVRSGVGSIRELSAQDPERLLRRIGRLEGRVRKPIQKNTIGLKVVESWIASAGSHPETPSSTKPHDIKTQETQDKAEETPAGSHRRGS